MNPELPSFSGKSNSFSLEVLERRCFLSAAFAVDAIGGEFTSEAIALNDSGAVVGHFSLADCVGGENWTHAFLWTKSDGFHDLGTLGGNFSNAFAINSQGTVVGSARLAGGEYHPFVFSGGALRDLAALAGTNVGASYIDDQNRILAGVADDQGKVHLLLYSNSQMTDLGTLPGLETYPNGFSEALYIDDAGTVSVKITEHHGDVHIYQPEDGELVEQGEYDLAGVALGTLLNLDNDAAITARGKTLIVRHGQDIAQLNLSDKTAGLDKIWLNNVGTVVGNGYEQRNGESYRLPFILDGNVLRDLNSLIPAGWILEDVSGINNAGQIIGNGWHNGVLQGFLLTPIPGSESSNNSGPTDVKLTRVAAVSHGASSANASLPTPVTATDVHLLRLADADSQSSRGRKHHHRRPTASSTRKATLMLPRAFYGFA